MRVGVDATSWINRRGFGRFTRNVVRRLVAIDAETTYVLFIDDATAAGADLPEGVERWIVRLRRPPAEAASADSSRGVSDLLRLTRAARRARVDAFLFTSIYTYFPVPRIPTVVGIHDTIADDHPDLTFPDRRARVFWRLKQRAALRAAARLFTVSEASRNAIASRLGIDPSALPIVPEAPDPVFAPASTEHIAEARAVVGLDDERAFFLYAGGISPHKNVEGLLEAYAALFARRPSAPALVLVGDLERETYHSSADSVRGRIAKLDLGASVILPGFVSDETLAALYSDATAVVLPSFAEGFGLPAVEAAACGAPLVVSDLAPHRASLRDGALFFAPDDLPALTDALVRVSDDERLRASLAERAQAAVSGLTWDAAAEQVRSLIREAANGGPR